jgi:FlaG/FlaF family flagellin (archaellin)
MGRITKNKNNIYTKLLKDKKGISPVITTVILGAVGIALAVAIGLWMSGLVATFTRFEKLEITSAYAISTNDGWTVYVTAKNTGSADATITTVMINGIPSGDKWGGNTVSSNSTTIPVGAAVMYTINLKSGTSIGNTKLTSGITLNIVLHSAAGKDYPASVTLP